MRYLFFAFFFFASTSSHAVNSVPCLLFKSGSWNFADKKQKKKEKFFESDKYCVQYSKEGFRKNLKIGKAFKKLKEKQKVWKEKEDQYKVKILSYESLRENHKKQIESKDKMIAHERKQSEIWKKAFIKANKKPQWYESPVFWFSMGVLVTAGVTVTLVLTLK